MADKYSNLLKKTACYGVVSYSFLLAKETGLLSSLMKADKPLTSNDIGKRIHILDRYAKEILGCLSAAGLVCVALNEEGSNVYYLENAATEALSNGVDFALPEMNYVKILMTRYDAVKSAVTSGKCGVVRYEQSFFDLMYDHRMKLSPVYLNRILEEVPGLKAKLGEGIDVIEFGCGSACTLITLANMFPKSHFTATDISSKNISNLREEHSNIPNIDFAVCDLLAIPERKNTRYDWLYMSDVMHDLPRPVDALKGMRRMMRETGSICTLVEPGCTGSHCEDAGDIFAAFQYTMSAFCCIPESFQNENSEALGLCMGKDAFLNVCKAAGFDMSVVSLPFRKALYISKTETEKF